MTPDPDDLLASVPKPPPTPPRYADRPPSAHWSPAEYAVAVLVVRSRGSAADYRNGVVWACRTLGREPVPTPAAKPFPAEHVTIVERKTVTDLLSGGPKTAFDFLRREQRGLRAGRPLSWAERCKLLLSYERKTANRRPRVAFAGLLTLLDRTEDDTDLLERFLRDAPRLAYEAHDETGAGPTLDDDVAGFARTFVTAPSPTNWECLYEYLSGG